jgi:hypothetical protein
LNDCFQWMHLNHGDEGLKRAFRRMYHQVTVAALPCSIADPGCFFRIRFFSNPDPGSEFFLSRILSKEFEYFNSKKWLSSFRKYDPGCTSRIPGSGSCLITYPGTRIPDPGIKKAPNPGSGSATLLPWRTAYAPTGS